MRTVLESSDLLDVLFEHCDATTLVQLSSVNRLFEAASAPIIYRNVDLSVTGRRFDGRTTLSSSDGSPTHRQIDHLFHARAMYLLPEEIHYDLSWCYFAGVEVVEVALDEAALSTQIDSDEEQFEQEMRLADLVAVNMAKCPELRPSTVIDCLAFTILVGRRDHGYRLPPEGEEYAGVTSYHITRLVTELSSLSKALDDQILLNSADIDGRRRTLLHVSYPNLLEIVIDVGENPRYYDLLRTCLVLVEDGYSVILVGYQEQNHDRGHVQNKLIDLMQRRFSPVPRSPVPDVDCLVDNLVDRVHKISLREFYALPYGRYYGPAGYHDSAIQREEKYYRDQSITMRFNSNISVK
jgi:hypothetical protein